MDDSTRDSALNGQCLGQGAVKRGGAFGQAAGQEPSCRTGRQTGEKPFVSILDRSGALEQSAGQEMIPRAVCWTGAERSNRGLDRRRALGQFAGNWTGAEPSDNMLDRSGALGSLLDTVQVYSRVQANGQDTLDSVRNNVRDNVLHGALNKTWTVPLAKVHGYPIFGQWTVPPDSACITRPA